MATFTNFVKRCFLGTLLFTAAICTVVLIRIIQPQNMLPIYVSPNSTSQRTTVTVASTNSSNRTKFDDQTLPLCPEVPPNISLPMHVNLSNITLGELQLKYPASSPGGRYKPRGCRSRVKLAVIIPYRDREEHLCLLLNNLIPFLNRQQADFNIYITEQSPGGVFNRGLLINAGVREALKGDNYTCIVIHDVDLIPETSDNYYRCHENPFHLSTANGKYGYKMPYRSYSGGNIAITPQQFFRINGFSNWYFGWGGEDDDFEMRVKTVGMRLVRNPYKQGRYFAIKHIRDKLNPENPKKMLLFRSTRRRMKSEGFSTLHTNQTVLLNGTHTWVRVTIDEPFYNATIKLG